MQLNELRLFGVDYFCFGRKFLTFNLVSRNLKVKYRRSILGVFWTLLGPIAMALVYFFVFKVVLRIEIPYYPVFILAGVLPWTFFSQSLMEGMESIVGNWGLVSKIPIPLQVLPFVGTVTNLVTLFVALPILLAAAVLIGAPTGASLVLLPFYFLLLFLITYSLSLLLSLAFVLLRDLRHIMGIVMQIWFYATPVIYDEKMIPENLQWALYVNPVGTIFAGIHEVTVRGGWPPVEHVAVPAFWAIFLTLAAARVFRSASRGLVELL